MASGLENIETIESPFRRFVTTIGVFPTAFTDAMTYYECLAYLVKYLEDSVVPAVNENAEALKELQDYVVHYFDNLDVQEEINNKLDAMVEAGTLQEIIGAYLNATAVWGFDTVADMKTATNLINGSYARTLGYHTKGDGGAALYKIRTVTNDDVVDEASIIEMADDTLVAEFVNEDKGFINVNKFGLTDQLYMNDYWTPIYNYALAKGCYIYFPTGTYKVKKVNAGNDYIFSGKFISMEGKNATILCESSVDDSTDLFKFTEVNKPHNQFIKGIKFDTATNDYSEVRYFLHFVFGDLKLYYNLQIEDNIFMKSSSYAIYTLGNATTGGFNNCSFSHNIVYGLFISSANYGDSNKIIGNSLFASENTQLGDYPIKLTQTNGSSGCIVSENNCSGGLGQFTNFFALTIFNNQIENVYQNLDYLIKLVGGANAKIDNCNLNAHNKSDLIYSNLVNTVIDNCTLFAEKTYVINSYGHLAKISNIRWWNGTSYVLRLTGDKVQGAVTNCLYTTETKVYYVDNECMMHIRPLTTGSVELAPFTAEADCTYPYSQPVEFDSNTMKTLYRNNQFYVRSDVLLNTYAIIKVQDF